MKIRTVSVLSLILIGASFTFAQPTAFSHQGSLSNNGNPASGSYDFEFRLFDAATNGIQVGSTVQRLNVTVTNGIFSVSLDFGATVFPGAGRFLDIAVRPTGGGAFTPLSPRQPITSTPYAIKSISAENALNLNGIPAGQYAASPSGSSGFIHNTTTTQPSSNFSISGNGTAGGTLSANIVNSAVQYSLGGNRILSNPLFITNLFAGVGAGQANTGSDNSFFGFNAGEGNTTGNSNSFYGVRAGFRNEGGRENSFFGWSAGQNNTANHNSFFGRTAGRDNTTGTQNSYFGSQSGGTTASGSNNSFFGADAGTFFVSGSRNTIIGSHAGYSTSEGNDITLLGYSIDVADNLSFATAIGSGSVVTTSNTVVLGRAADIVRVPGGFAAVGGLTTNGNLTVLGTSNLVGLVDVATLGTAGGTDVCRNASNQLSTCSSSLRYKTDVIPFRGGLEVVRRLRPITFKWTEGDKRDIGFGAEDVAGVEPLLTTYNAKGEIEGVKYKQITAVLVNAVKEQQTIIEKQQQQIDTLKQIVCALKRDAAACKEIHK